MTRVVSDVIATHKVDDVVVEGAHVEEVVARWNEIERCGRSVGKANRNIENGALKRKILPLDLFACGATMV